MWLGPDYHGSWSMVPGMGGRVETSEELLETIEDVRSVAERYGLEDTYEQIAFRDGDSYTLDELDREDDPPQVIEEVEAMYSLSDDRTVELTYTRSVFDDNAFLFVWGDDGLRTDVEDETGQLLYGNGWRRLFDLGRSLWRELD